MAAGINDLVEQKVNAYRGNPQKLMQRYQQNQELVDLLALQKMKSEKEAAARQMQMQMEQTPQTIAQQREQEVLGLTKNELAQQTAGIMQQRQRQQQQGLQRMAKAASGAPAGGIAGLAPQGARPAPRMAGGGIVAFQGGGGTDREALEARKRELIERLKFRRNDPEASAELQRINEQLGAPSTMGEALRQMAPSTATGLPAMAQPTAAAPAGPSGGAPSGPSTPAPAGPSGVSGLAGLTGGREFFPTEQEEAGIVAAAKTAGPAIAPGSVTGVSVRPDPATTVPNVEPPAAATPDRLGRLGDLLEGIAGEDIEAAGTAATQAAREGYKDPTTSKDILTQMQERLKKFSGDTDKEFDSEDERLDRLISFATGAANKSRASSALAAGAESSMGLRKEQRKARIERNKSIMDMANNIDLTRIGIEKDVQARASEALSRASARVNAAIQAASNIASAEMRSADANADRVLQAAGINAKTAADNAANALREARNVIADRQATAAERQAAARALTAELETLNQLDQRILTQSATIALDIEQKGELDTLTAKREQGLTPLTLEESTRLAELQRMVMNQATSAGAAGGLDIQQRMIDITQALQELSGTGSK